MRKFLFLVIIVMFGCTSQDVDSSWKSIQKKGVLVVGFDEEFAPMTFKEDNEFTGFDIDLAREAAARMNIKLELKPIKWSDKEHALNDKEVDCIWSGFTVTADREKRYLFTRSYMDNRQVIVVPAKSTMTSVIDLKNKKIAMQEDSTAITALEKRADLKNYIAAIRKFSDNTMVMTDLDFKNSDAVIIDSIVINYRFMKKYPGRYRILDSIVSEKFAVGFRLGETELKNTVEDALREMYKDGTMEKISIKWFGKNITIFR